MNQEERDFLAEVEALVKPLLATPEHRLYYNELGEIVSGSTAEHLESGQYIVVTEEEYNNYFRYRVANQKLQLITQENKNGVKLTKSIAGYAVVKNQASLIIEPNEEYTNIEYYGKKEN